ncbi:helix-turn-helix transcriptional regulator [Embleya sp. NBC_00896]|uniref:PadR family transcriptional regulator n=1 Tax=Embleya sp. NBC_00896 TaxID=2975961 RepID=UPI002F9138B1|nr:helix-turn-helix transcriptional regulator [Embleya sp. NBC_00896]
MKAEVLKGHLEGMLLAVLETGEQHGYAIVEELKARSGGHIALPTGTVYPALHRLETAGLIAGRWSVHGGRRRRSYELTRAGRRALKEQRSSWREFTSVVSGVMGVEPGWTVTP